MTPSFLRLQSLGTALSQNFNRGIAVHQFAPLGLAESFFNVGGYNWSLPYHPIFQLKLFPDNLKRLIENLAGILIGSGLDREIDNTLLLGFKVNRHDCSFPLS
jgi:hypothetical protein